LRSPGGVWGGSHNKHFFPFRRQPKWKKGAPVYTGALLATNENRDTTPLTKTAIRRFMDFSVFNGLRETLPLPAHHFEQIAFR